jgi:TonB-dependent starch-binding outer membrane protein SusC
MNKLWLSHNIGLWIQKILRKMKLTVFLLCISTLASIASTGYAQSTKLTVIKENATVKSILDEIQNQSEFKFFYSSEVDVDRIATIDMKDKVVFDILDELFKDTDVNYVVFDRQIALVVQTKSGGNDDFSAIGMQQPAVKGKVTDAAGQALPGVTVVVKGTTQGTITNSDGEYSILNIPPNSILVFSFVGMRTEEVAVGNQTTINVTLEEETIGIDEVVAIGYGTVRKSDLTGSVSSVKAEELQATPITSIDQGLVGRAAGVMVTQTSGMPGAIASIRVRGTSSLQGGNEPLYVIDGFPVYNGTGFGNTGGSTRYSGLSTINPSDIESIEILKDASATSIYGARAANGVVLITTKSGRRGTDLITFDATYGVQSVVKKIDVMNALQYAELSNEAYLNDGLTPPYDEAEMQQIRQNPEGTDWQNEVFRSAPSQNYQLTFSGGDQKMIYSVSANYYDQEGIIRSSDFKRYSGRINLERNILANFRVGTNFTMSKTISNAVRTDAGGNQGVVSSAMKFNPISPVFINEELKIYTPVNSPGIIYANPVATADEMIRENQAVRLLGNIFAEWEIIPDLKAKVSFGTDLFNTKFNTYIPSNIYESGGVASATVNGGYTTNWLNENTLSWNKEINKDHQISLLGGITFQQNHYEGVTASSQDYVNDVLKYNSLQAGATYNQPSSSNTDWSLISYLARANYNFKERYLLSVSARVDGSSRFGTNNKYALFPSGSFAWRLIEEDFIQDLGFFDNLKLRTSYGFTGNQEIGLYNSLPTLTSTTYTIGRALVTGFYPNKIPNPDLKWEKTSQLNVGIDIGLLNNKFRITSDYYYKKTTDLIYSVGVPFVSGFSTSLQNIGSVENKGLELGIESDNITGPFQWTTNFNIAFNRNKILELGGEDYKDVGAGDGHLKTGSVHRLIVGEPIGLFYGYVFDGIFQDQTELDAGPKSPTNWIGGRRYADLGGPEGVPDGVVNATYDRTVIGDPNPDFFGGLTNTFLYKGFELNLFLQYSYGNDIFNYNAMELELPSGGQNVYADLVNRWTPTNPSNKYPVATTNRSAVFSSAYMEDGSYLKVKTLTFAYLFPDLNTRHLSGLKLYVTGQNLLTFTNYKGYDPEVSYRGATNLELGEDFGGYPQARTFLFGVSLNIK